MGFNKVLVETDYKLALLLILKADQSWNWKLDILLSKILHICNHREVRFAHLYREGNSVVDALAKDALREVNSTMFDPTDLPIIVRQLAYNDKVGLAYIRRINVPVLS